MGTLLAFLAVFFFFAFLVGLIKPSLVKMPNRKRLTLVYLGGAILFSIVGSIIDPVKDAQTGVVSSTKPINDNKAETAKFEHEQLSLGDYRIEPTKTRHDIVDEFIAYKKMPTASSESMYACLSQYSFTKSAEMKLGDVLCWCFADYERSPSSLRDRINFDIFQGNFSVWDGSYRPLETLIKQSMNDEDSYSHVSTTYSLILNKDPHAVVKTIFRGKNGYGAVMKNSVVARVNIKTGEVEKILE